MKKKIIIILLIVLALFSIANNYFDLVQSNNYIKQLIWFLIGFLGIYLIFKLNISFFIKNSFLLYIFGNILLIITLLYGNIINGARIWLNIGPFSFQPSEFMKIFLILYLKYFTLKYSFNDFKYVIITFIIVLIPSILTFLEPDTGAVLIYFIIWIVFLFLKKINKWYYITFILALTIFLGSFLIMYYKFQDIFISIFGSKFFYRMDRITNFISGEGYQLNEALKSISNSGLFGIKEKVYFPESATDFALTLFISNFGIIGLSLLLIIYNVLFYLLGSIKTDKYLSYPTLFIILFQYSVNILMNIGLFPIIGITLPFISYGGSSVITNMLLIGFVLKEKVSEDTYL